jgi:hypothetical protein
MNKSPWISEKLPYLPPLLERFDYVVERGFENSVPNRTQAEKWSEINDRSEIGHAGENQTGDWLNDTEW